MFTTTFTQINDQYILTVDASKNDVTRYWLQERGINFFDYACTDGTVKFTLVSGDFKYIAQLNNKFNSVKPVAETVIDTFTIEPEIIPTETEVEIIEVAVAEPETHTEEEEIVNTLILDPDNNWATYNGIPVTFAFDFSYDNYAIEVDGFTYQIVQTGCKVNTDASIEIRTELSEDLIIVENVQVTRLSQINESGINIENRN
ncbi:MAG: hypothetical protein WBF90_33715 [Rivularia sp. (in: cyanobacteria)]